MSFSNDEALLNDLNVGSIVELQRYMEQLRPILLEESGYQQTNLTRSYEEARTALLKDEPFGQPMADGTQRAGTLQREIDVLSQELNNFGTGTTRFVNTGGLSSKVSKEQLQNEIAARQQKLDTRIKTAQNYTGLGKTEERKSLEARFNKLAEIQLQQVEEQAAYQSTPEYKARLAGQRELEGKQQSVQGQLLDRQTKALNGEIGASDVLRKQIADEFAQFKETQARAGNTIVGDDVMSAVGKGSAAIESLRSFQDNAKAAMQREQQGIIQGELPLSYAGLGLSADFTGGAGQLGAPGVYGTRTAAYNMSPASLPNAAGFNQLALGAQQPFQFNRQLDQQLQIAQMNNGANRRSLGSQLLSTGVGIGGMALGSYLGGPIGGAMGGSIAGGMGGRTAQTPQFGQVWSPSR